MKNTDLTSIDVALLFREYRITQIDDMIKYIENLMELNLTDFSKEQLKEQKMRLQGEKLKYEYEIKNKVISILGKDELFHKVDEQAHPILKDDLATYASSGPAGEEE